MKGYAVIYRLLLLAAVFFTSPAWGSWAVKDGDTFYWGQEEIRLFNVDAPELTRWQCARARDIAIRATARLAELLAAGNIDIRRVGVDRYGRTLAVVSANGHDVGQTLIREGLALPWTRANASWRYSVWCGETRGHIPHGSV